jgi:tripartite-type tricarboxylate transporter receptor subunit TctC
VPTYAESGFPGFFAASWVGFFAPAKTDQQIINALNGAINDTIKNPQVQKKLATIGFDPITGSPAQADAMFKAEVTKWGEMVKTLNLSVK